MYKILLITLLTSLSLTADIKKALAIKVKSFEVVDATPKEVAAKIKKIWNAKGFTGLVIVKMDGRPAPKVTMKLNNVTTSKILLELTKKAKLDYIVGEFSVQIGNDPNETWTRTKEYKLKTSYMFKIRDYANKNGLKEYNCIEEFLAASGVPLRPDERARFHSNKGILSIKATNHRLVLFDKLVNK